jgi:DNA repair protein RadC
MTAKQKANQARFKKVVAEAKKLRKKNPKLTQAQAVKQAWAMTYTKKKVAGYEGTSRKGKNTLVYYTNSRIKGVEKYKDSVRVSGYEPTKEIVVGKIGKLETLKTLVPEVKLRITRGKKTFSNYIRSSQDSADIFKKFITKNKVETQEFFAVAYLNTSLKVLGVYVSSMGTLTATTVDVRLIMAAAVQMGATAIIVCHNHPSGNTQYSSADAEMTKQIVKAAKLLDIRLLDHVIITKDSHYSFADNGMI